MTISSPFRPVLAGLALALALWPAVPAFAAQRDLDLLQSYVGEWQGRGTMGTGGDSESVKCSLKVTSSEATRIQFNGRCALAGGTVTLKGTMGYIQERNRYEAVLNSDVPFLQDQVAVGTRGGSGITFTLRPHDTESNADFDINVDLALRNGLISVDATLIDTGSGNRTTAKVPLEKKS